MVQPIKVSYTPTQEDFAKVLRLFFIRRISTIISLAVMAVAFGMIIYYVISKGTTPSLFELVWLLLPPLFVVYIIFIQPSRSANRVAQNEQLLAESTWEVNQSGLTISDRFGSTSMGWDILIKIVDTQEYYLLYNKVNRNTFRFIPKRAFSSTNEQDSFLAYIKSHLSTA